MPDPADTETPLTVIQVIPRLKAGGAEKGCLQVAEALVQAGHRAIVVSQGGRLEQRLAEVGGELVRYPVASKNPWVMWRNAQRLKKLIRDTGARIIHARSRAPAWSCLIAARATGIGFVTSYHSGYSENGRLKNLYNSVMARCDRVIAVSEYMAKLIRERYHPPESRITVIHRGADPETFDPARFDPELATAMRTEWGVPESAPRVLLAGRLAPRKAQDIVVEATGLLAQRGLGDFHVIFAGDRQQGKDEYVARLQQRIADLDLGERIHLVGHISDMRTTYGMADIALCVSEMEGFPRVALESQAMGAPVIVSDIGPGREVAMTPPETPLEEASGLRVPYGDASALADALEQMLGWSPEQRREMGMRGSARVRTRYTIKRLTDMTLEVYRQVALPID